MRLKDPHAGGLRKDAWVALAKIRGKFISAPIRGGNKYLCFSKVMQNEAQ